MVARKIECELNDRAINPPRDTSRYQKEVGTFIWRLEAFAKNFAELRQFGQCTDVVLNRIGPKDFVKYETLKNIILRMAHESMKPITCYMDFACE